MPHLAPLCFGLRGSDLCMDHLWPTKGSSLFAVLPCRKHAFAETKTGLILYPDTMEVFGSLGVCALQWRHLKEFYTF